VGAEVGVEVVAVEREGPIAVVIEDR
jgi:hypothetical protein